MTALVRAELLQARTLRSTAWAAAALLVITVLTGTLAMGDAGEKGYRTPSELRETVIAIGYTAVFFMVVLGAVAAAGEYRHRTISQRFLVSPDRGRVLAAKLAAFGSSASSPRCSSPCWAEAWPSWSSAQRATRSTSPTAGCGSRPAPGSPARWRGCWRRRRLPDPQPDDRRWWRSSAPGSARRSRRWLGAGGRFLPYTLAESCSGLGPLSLRRRRGLAGRSPRRWRSSRSATVLPRDVT
jgi:hypothetical protein